MQSRYSWKYRRTGYVRFSSLGQNKMSVYWVYDLKSCRSYMIRLEIQYNILWSLSAPAVVVYEIWAKREKVA